MLVFKNFFLFIILEVTTLWETFQPNFCFVVNIGGFIFRRINGIVSTRRPLSLEMIVRRPPFDPLYPSGRLQC